MRKSLLISAVLFVLSTSPALAIYRTDGPQPTPSEDGTMLMAATADAAEDTVKSRAMEAKDAMKQLKIFQTKYMPIVEKIGRKQELYKRFHEQ